MRAFSLLTLLLPFVAANQHKHCYCRTWTAEGGWISNNDLSHYICYYTNHAHWDPSLNRCQADDDYYLEGQPWEDACKNYGVQEGYYPFDGGDDEDPDITHPLIRVGAAVGSCPDRD
ncbi:hypothetical protein E4U58_004702 [Claviceps cyperi]|nr:hypothetical protein E4U58_004702 [Claviceps cyperi]